MPRAEQEAIEAATGPDGSLDFATFKAAYERGLARSARDKTDGRDAERWFAVGVGAE